MRGETSFGCGIYQDAKDKNIFIIPLSKSIPSGAGGFQDKIYHIKNNTDAFEIGEKALSAIKDAVDLPVIKDTEGMQNDFEKFGIGKYRDGSDREKKCYYISYYFMNDFATEFNKYFIGSNRDVFMKFPDLIKKDELYKISPNRHENGTNWGNANDPVFLLPYPSTPEVIGKTILEAFQWIDDNYGEKK